MKTIKPDKLGLLVRVFESDQRCYFVVTVFVFFPFQAPKKLLSEVELWKFAPGELTAENGVLDEGLSKPKGEVLVTGRCHPPGGEPQAVSFVRLKLGSVDKRLAVLGDRRFGTGGIPTEPEPFTEMPVDWAHAYGGAGFAANPLGKGFGAVEGPDGTKSHPMPNIEEPGRLMVNPSDKRTPVGFGAYELTWPQRYSKVGTYDTEWFETRFPGVAKDLDPTFYNAAPEDQRIQGYFTGDETFLIENMHPTKPRLEGSLPPIVIRAFVTQRGEAGEAFREIPTRLETIRLFPHAEKGVLVFRGMIEVAEDDGADVAHIVIGGEDRAFPKSADHYREVLEKRLAKKHQFAADRDLMPPPAEGWDIFFRLPEVHDAVRSENLLRKNLEGKRERMFAETRAKMVAAGLDTSALDPPPMGEPPIDDPEALDAYMEKLQTGEDDRKKEMDEAKERLEERAREAYAEQGIDYDKAVQQVEKEDVGPPKFRAQAHLQQMEELLKLGRDNDAPLEEMEAEVRAPGYLAQLQRQEEQMREMYRRSAHLQGRVDPLGVEASERARAELTAAKAAGIGMPDRDFTGADLSGLDLSGLDLRGAFLESATLEGTRLDGADLSNAVLAGANLARTGLARAKLTGANLGRARFDGADLAGADLEGAILSRAKIANSSFRGAKIERVNLLETEFGEGVDFGEVSAKMLVFFTVDVSRVRFTGADLTKATLLECKVEDADFSGVNLTQASFLSCQGNRAIFREARLEKAQFVHGSSFEEADFTDAVAPSANFRGTKLRAAKFGRTRLDGADLSDCDLTEANLYRAVARQARFVRADLTGAGMISIDLLGAVLQKAKIFRADLTGANMFRADLAKIRVDGATKIGEANLKQARTLPRDPHAAK
jgi:uncharacterized protein YjbI with pentapeptide repeats